MSNDIGLYGLAIMGQNFALNMAEHGFKVAVSNRSREKIDATVARAKAEGNLPIEGHHDIADFVHSISKPRKIVILVQAGAAVDDTIAQLAAVLEAGDIIIDGGNEWFPNSVRRFKELEAKNINFVGMGVSGGEEGARNGPSLMPGCTREVYDLLAPIITKCAAQVDDGACTTYLGPIGSGNYVKMVHNGIEYGDMQLIGEIYDILKRAGGLTNDELAEVFREWNSSELNSFLIEITATIFAKKDDESSGAQGTPSGYVLDKILDKTGMKGTGRWTIQEAAERSVCGSVMAAALDARYISGRKDERIAASELLKGPTTLPNVERSQIIEDAKDALYCAKIVSYAQGLGLIKAASDDFKWDIDLGECARIWKGGCIIRAGFLDLIKQAFQRNTSLPNLLVDSYFADQLNTRHTAWRRIVTFSIASGIPVPALSSAISYYDSYRREVLPANLTQAQRDYFGGHSFERTDRPGAFHAKWSAAHKDIGNVDERNKGNL